MRNLRNRAGLTQAAFAALMDMTKNGYQRIEAEDDLALSLRNALTLDMISLSLAIERENPTLLTPNMRAKMRRFERIAGMTALL